LKKLLLLFLCLLCFIAAGRKEAQNSQKQVFCALLRPGRKEAQNSQKQDDRPEKAASFFLCLLCIIAAGTGRSNELWMKRNSRWGESRDSAANHGRRYRGGL
jgi:hypothetical protein